MSLLICHCGAKFTGKTTRAIEIAKSFNLPIIVNNKQREIKYLKEKKIFSFYGSVEEYIKIIEAGNKRNNKKVYIIEEATVYLPLGSQFTSVVDCFLSARFNGNVYILNFHAPRQIPEYILPYIDYFVLSRTAGNLTAIKKKFSEVPGFINTWLQLQNPKKPYEAKIIKNC